MAKEKIFEPTVTNDTPFPGEEQEYSNVSQSSANQTYSPATIPEQSIPTKRIAVELLSTAMNTKSRKIHQDFQFTKSGAISVGEYENGVSGEVKISPAGIAAKNKAGVTTFALDGDTGDAVFAGRVQAGTLISGAVAVGDGSIIIDGETKRMIFYADDGTPQIVIGNI